MELTTLVTLFLVTAGVYVPADAVKKIPDYVKLCKRNDPNLSECWSESFRSIIPYMLKGIPEMNLRAIDPFLVDKLAIDFGNSSSVSFNAQLRDMRFFGFKGLHLEKAAVDLDKVNFYLEVKIPDLQMVSKYRARGKVLLFQFDSNGDFTGNFTNINVKGIWSGTKYIKKGKEHADFNKSDIDVKIGTIKMYFENLFPNEEINARTNEAINTNIDILYDELKPLIEETIKSVIVDAVNSVYNLYPLEVLYPE